MTFSNTLKLTLCIKSVQTVRKKWRQKEKAWTYGHIYSMKKAIISPHASVNLGETRGVQGLQGISEAL